MLNAKYKGLSVEWQYIVFDYNKDDIQEAKEIAKFHKIPLMLIFSNRPSLSGDKIVNVKRKEIKS